jgi:hypothetical protein
MKSLIKPEYILNLGFLLRNQEVKLHFKGRHGITSSSICLWESRQPTVLDSCLTLCQLLSHSLTTPGWFWKLG